MTPARVRASAARPAAVVAKCGWVNGLAAIRSLGRAGADVIAVDYGRSALGFHSRYARPALCPHPLDDERAFVAFLSELGASLETPAPVFPTNDELLNAISRNRDVLGDRFLFPFPGWDVVGPIQLKRFQVERAAALGIPHPRTVHEPTDELGYPVLVKPSDPAPFQRAYRCHAFRCESRPELEAAMERARPYDPLVQELIPGGDDELYTLGSYLAEDGEALGLFCGRKLRQTPPGVGTCRVGESVWVDEVVEQGLRYLRGLGLHGISQVEFKRDPRDGSFRLMEVNPRLWQWHGLAAACGVDLPRIAYEDLMGERPQPVAARGPRKRWAITLVAGDGLALPRPPFVDAVFARDDPKPALVQAARVLVPGRPRRWLRRAFHRGPGSGRRRAGPAGRPA